MKRVETIRYTSHGISHWPIVARRYQPGVISSRRPLATPLRIFFAM